MADLSGAVPAAIANGFTAAGMTTGMPPQDVMLWSMIGALAAVWLDQQKGVPLSRRWVLRAVGMIFVSVASGIAGSAALIAVPDAPIVGFVAKVPQWVLAFFIAALIHLVGPALFKRWLSTDKKAEAGNVAP